MNAQLKHCLKPVKQEECTAVDLGGFFLFVCFKNSRDTLVDSSAVACDIQRPAKVGISL